jgi:hypothetical protein
VLDAAEITGCLAEAKALLAREKKVSWDDAGGNVMDWIADPEIKGEAMRRLALHPKITGIAERLAGIPLRLFKSELLLKRDKGSASTPFHVDEPGSDKLGEDDQDMVDIGRRVGTDRLVPRSMGLGPDLLAEAPVVTDEVC